jgi:hypothetical protein
MGSRPYGLATYGFYTYGGGHTLFNDFSKFQVGIITLIEITLEPDGEKLYISNGTARYVQALYDGKMINVGAVRRVLQKTTGIFQSSTVEIVLSDTDQIYSLKTANLKGSSVSIKIGSENMTLGTFQEISRGIIDNYAISGFTLQITLKDKLFDIPEFPLVGDLNETDFPNSYAGHRGLPLPLCYGTHSVTNSDDNRDRGAFPTLYINNGIGTKKFLIARHAVKSIDQVYVTKSTGSSLLTAVTHYTPVTSGIINGSEMAYIEFTDAQFSTNVLDGGSLGLVTVNVQGRMNADGTVMTNPIDVLNDILSNYLGNPLIDSTSFNTSTDIADARIYTVIGGYTDKRTSAELLQDLCRSFNIRMFITKDGNVGASIFAPAPLGQTVKKFDEARDIFAGSFAIDHDSNIEGAQDTQIINKCNYLSHFHQAKKSFFKSEFFDDAESIARFEEKLFVLQANWADSDSASDVAQRLIFQFKQPVPHYRFRTGLQGALVDLADQIGITHANGPAGVAIDDQNVEVIEHVINPMNGEIDIRAIDVEALTDDGFFLDDESSRVRASSGTAGVVNTDNTITITGGPGSLITAGVVVNDIIRLKTGLNISHNKITAVTATTVDVANTVWTTESSITYDILPSWLTASSDQKIYGYLGDETTGEFSNGDDMPVLL